MSSTSRMRRALKRTVAAMVVTAVGVVAFSSAGVAQAPDAYGWWYEANSGLPAALPPPPSVPNNGLYIENGLNGPAAISALSFTVPNGAAVGALVLHVAGTPVMSQPPLACPLSSSFASVQEGQWSQRPSYDCHKAQVTGQVDSADTTVSFDTSSLLANGHVSVAILAGGPADSVAFDQPGSDALAVTPVNATPSPAGPGGGLQGGASQGAVNPSFTPVPQSIGITPGAAGSAPGGSGPVSASPAQGRGGGITHHVVAASAKRGASLPSLMARVLGLGALGLLLLAWTEGYGILGGRIKGLASPLSSSRDGYG